VAELELEPFWIIVFTLAGIECLVGLAMWFL
jgi:hypothetical protein